ncbi:MAG: hypothetical protein LC641_03315 [Spirochaeta sp.]|nr:hypothetical protein [Spirochaeta sp.]
MPQQSEITVLITPNIPNPADAGRVLARLLTFLGSAEFWGRGPLVWNLSEAELRASGLASAFRARITAGDQLASAGYSKIPHSLLTMEELAREIGTHSDSPDKGRPAVIESDARLVSRARCAVIPPWCDAERREADVAYRALDVPFVLGKRQIRKGEQLVGYRQGILTTAPLRRFLAPGGGERVKPRRLRQIGRDLCRIAAHRGHYLVLHALVTDEESVELLIHFFRETGASAKIRSRIRLVDLRLPHTIEPKAELNPERSITPLHAQAGDPLAPARLYRVLALREPRSPLNILDTWLSVARMPDSQSENSINRSQKTGNLSSRYQVVASMQGESSLSEGELELRCTEGAPSELRVSGETVLYGIRPIAEFSMGSQGIALEARGVVSIESEFARGLAARFAFAGDDLATSQLSVRYLFFDGAPELFIELEFDFKAPAGFAGEHNFTCFSFRAPSGAVVYATHPLQKQSEIMLMNSYPRYGIAESLRVEKGDSALDIGALAPATNSASAVLYSADSRLSLGPSYGPAQTTLVDGLFDRRVLILSATRPGHSASRTVSASIRSQLYDPICFVS